MIVSNRFTNYNGVWLYTEQAEALFDIEFLLETPIPDISNNSMGSFGFIHDNYNVLELRLFQSYFQEKAQLNELPKSIGNLEEMHTLDVSHNKLENLPSSISNLEGLEKFYLDYNNFKIIPDVLTKLENLRQINFDENILQYLPKSIAEVPYLQSLHLAGNILRKFPTELVDSKYLKRLVLNRNRIQSLDYTILDDFSQLYVIDLRSNHIPNDQIDKAFAFLKLSGKRRRKYYLKGQLNTYEHPYSIRNISKRIKSDPLLDIERENDKLIEELALRIKSSHDNRYSTR